MRFNRLMKTNSFDWAEIKARHQDEIRCNNEQENKG
jgi:hypothetical protein